VKAFQQNLGTVVPKTKRPQEFSVQISATPSCDSQQSRLLLADYIARVYNGTAVKDILRLSLTQLVSFIQNLEWIYVVPNMPDSIATYFADKRRSYPGEKNAPANAPLATNTMWSNRGHGGTPINVVSTNWDGDRNQAYLFQTIMEKGSSPQWWGDYLFTDPTRSSLRRGMMNSPQNQRDLYDARFGYGGIPCNVLFEGGILPVDSAFAPAGMIDGPLAVPNICNPKNNQSCQLISAAEAATKKPRAVYTYYCPGSGMFFASGQCAYMYNFIDGFLNLPAECYSATKQQPGDPATKDADGNYPDLWSDVLTKRLPNGLPDHVTGVSKLLIYLARKVVWNETALKHAQAKAQSGTWQTGEQAKWQEAQAWPEDLKSGTLQVRLPKEADTYLANAEDRFHNGGIGLVGNVNPLDTNAPPRAYVGPRALQAQVAALMGIYEPTVGTQTTVTRAEYYGHGLFTPKGTVKTSQCPFIDKRKYAMGWINGRWYGYPPVDKWNTQTQATKIPGAQEEYQNFGNLSECVPTIGAQYVSTNKLNYTHGGIYTKGGTEGVPGEQVESNEKWTTDGYFMPTQDNPLIYYGFKDPQTGQREELYRTWYGKPITMDYPTACKLIGMFYSMGDTGWEESMVCWPFGSYFSYAEDLGLGKYVIGGNLQDTFGAQSLHYTMTSTSLAKAQFVSPAYDYEIVLTLGDKRVQSLSCFCQQYMKSVDLFYNNGQHLANYCSLSKGALGGWFPEEAGVEYDGSKGLSNFTYVLTEDQYQKNAAEYDSKGVIKLGSNPNYYGSFNPATPNMVTGLTNELKAVKC
jgi:hypothetical protein